MTASQKEKPGEREHDRPSDANQKNWRAVGLWTLGGAIGPAILSRVKRVVGHGDFSVLGDCGWRAEDVGVQTAMRVVVEGDTESLAGIEADDQRGEGRRLELAGGDVPGGCNPGVLLRVDGHRHRLPDYRRDKVRTGLHRTVERIVAEVSLGTDA